MTTTQPREQDQPSPFVLAVDFLKVRFWSIIAVCFAIGAVLVYLEVDFELPRFWLIFVLAFAVGGIPLGLLSGSKVVSLLHNPRRIWLVDLDARVLEGGIFRFSVDEFRSLQVTDEEGNTGADYSLTQLSDNLYVGKQLDLEEQTVVGTWRGTLDDVELARALAAVARCRGELQQQAQRGFAIETAAPGIVANALRGEVDDVIETIEAGTLPDEGDAISEAIEDRLDELGFEDHLDQLQEDLDADPGDERDPDEFERDQERSDNGSESDQPTPEVSVDD
ncbi:hypothetical protein [Haloparvum sedimenti]|uniref:hypothetical protein n=1 Tax=Haloparvum sedimenti TaxID=1678448 RepID=UPI00071E800A|nr:hypothetical protein [Haloparvum sedimenti]